MSSPLRNPEGMRKPESGEGCGGGGRVTPLFLQLVIMQPVSVAHFSGVA